jgi:CRISPR-associated protein Csm2
MTTFNGIDGVKKAPEWIKNGISQETIKFAESFGKDLSDGRSPLTTSQIRNVYGEVQRIKMKGFDKTALLLLKPRFAYMTKRKGTDGSKDFHSVMDKALDVVIDEVNGEKQVELFGNFADFFEAILAYHRAFGGK